MRVFLVRHAEAEPGEPDALRQLTPDGRATARALGDELAERGVAAVVSSPLLRARETADAIARAVGCEVDIHDGLAPGAIAETLRDALSGRPEPVVAVGHQPDCSEIVEQLNGEKRSFAPGSYAELEL